MKEEDELSAGSQEDAVADAGFGAAAALSAPIETAAAAPDDRAQAIARGVSRMLGEAGQTCVHEFTLRNGRRADVMAMAPDGTFTIIEIKSSVTDFRTDGKWPEYLEYCDQFYFAVGEDFPQELIPESCGLIVADAYGAVVLRDSVEDRLNGSRRRMLLLRYAEVAGRRLMSLLDPARRL
jgi:hypothetical protein